MYKIDSGNLLKGTESLAQSSVVISRGRVVQERFMMGGVYVHLLNFPGGSVVKNMPNAGNAVMWKLGYDPWIRKIPWRKKLQPIPVILPKKSFQKLKDKLNSGNLTLKIIRRKC